MNDTTIDGLREERAELIRDIVAAVMLQVVPHVKQSLGVEYVTRDELQTKLVDAFTDVINHRFDEIDSAAELRHSALVQQTEARFALTATKEELAGVIAAGAENTSKLAVLEAAHDTRLKALETEAQAIRNTDAARAKEIGDIKASAQKTADNAQKTSEAVVKLIDQYEKRQNEIDRELENLKDAQDADVKNLRRVESEMHTLDNIFRDIDARVRDGMTRIEHALFGDEKAKTQGIFTIVKNLQKDLRLPALVFGTKWGRMFGIPAIYGFTIYWLQHPDLFAALNPFGR